MANERTYETVFIINPTLTEEEITPIIDKFRDLVASNGTVDKVDVWGKRKLAYPIEDYTEGYYVLISFKSQPEFPKELDRIFTITDNIIRSLIVCK